MYVSVNTRVNVEDLIKGVIVQSGNDASIVIAEGLSGSEPAFALELNELAKKLSMNNSSFVNSSGWPDPDHYTTARDLAKLARATINNFPDYYHYYAQKSFTYSGIKQFNRNPTLYRSLGADGLKTGRTKKAGFGLEYRSFLTILAELSRFSRWCRVPKMSDIARTLLAQVLFRPGESTSH